MTLHLESQKSLKYIQQVDWSDVRDQVGQSNVKFQSIIDAIDPNSKELPLIRVGYPFGEEIITHGKFMLLDKINSMLSAQENNLLHQWLDYIPIPFGIFLNKTCEIFFEVGERIIPLYTLFPGYVMGLFELLDGLSGKPYSYMPWQLVSGARSIFMLPKINNEIHHKKLQRKLNISRPTPKSLLQQWAVFKDIANSPSVPNTWACEILFLTTPWFEKLKSNNKPWILFREYLFQEAWFRSSSFIERAFSFMWQQFSSATSKRKFKPRMYIIDTIRHLVSIAFGTVAAFSPSTTDLIAPIKRLKQAYIEEYQLTKYMPTIITPCVLRPPSKTVYYSLGFPTLLEGQPEIENTRNTIADLKEIKLLMTNMREYCLKYLSHIKLIQDFLEHTEFEYFHKVSSEEEHIKHAHQIHLEDPNFNESILLPNNNVFCETGPFLNGCIRIRRM